MAKYKITYDTSTYSDTPEDEEVAADGFVDEGEWITFTRKVAGRSETHQVMRIRAKVVKRIDRQD